jgi:hypothetical protein
MKLSNNKFITILSVFITISKVVEPFRISSDDSEYHVEWVVDQEIDKINFKILAATTGFVGLGLSPQGGMAGADIVIGGVKDGVPYLEVRFLN